MTTTRDPYTLSRRPVASGRRLPDPLPDRLRMFRELADAAVAQPFTGITTGGTPIPGLFSLQQTGVSTGPIKDAAEAFLSTLNAEQRSAACFPIYSEQWQRWLNIHVYVMRHGVCLDSLTTAQRDAALGILETSLSAAGYELARNVMRLNHTIGEMTGSWEEYGEWLYWLSIFGTPSVTEPWGWQIDGHHLCVNCFVLGDQVVMTPVFAGSEPVHAPTGIYAGTRVLEPEERRGLELVRSLSPRQQDQAILFRSVRSDQLPRERFHGPDGRIEGGASRDNARIPYEGLRCDNLSPAQQSLLLSLVEAYTGRMRPGHAELKLAEVKRHLGGTHFAWMGETDDDAVFYYRIHSPVLLIEFDHESGIAFDNPEPTRTHIHTQVRTPNGNDYGKDLLRQHREQFHRR